MVRRDLFDDEKPYGREFAGVQRFEPLSREDDGFVDVLHTGRNDEAGYFYYLMELADDARAGAGSELDPESYQPRTLARALSGRVRMDVERCVDLGLRLGEGTGGALALHLLDAAARLHAEMATFESAGVAERTERPIGDLTEPTPGAGAQGRRGAAARRSAAEEGH